MADQATMYAQLVTTGKADPDQQIKKMMLVDSTGNAQNVGTFTPGVAVSDVTAADATDEASAVTLANANKVAINALIASLEGAGIIAEG